MHINNHRLFNFFLLGPSAAHGKPHHEGWSERSGRPFSATSVTDISEPPWRYVCVCPTTPGQYCAHFARLPSTRRVTMTTIRTRYCKINKRSSTKRQNRRKSVDSK